MTHLWAVCFSRKQTKSNFKHSHGSMLDAYQFMFLSSIDSPSAFRRILGLFIVVSKSLGSDEISSVNRLLDSRKEDSWWVEVGGERDFLISWILKGALKHSM